VTRSLGTWAGQAQRSSLSGKERSEPPARREEERYQVESAVAMPNRILTSEELKTLFGPLVDDVRAKLQALSAGNPELLFALRRKLYKELSYDERGKPTHRKVLKAVKYAEQRGRCAKCDCELEQLGKNAVLDRSEAIRGYIPENVRLLCHACDRRQQAERNYA
jgi:hypothetical protein